MKITKSTQFTLILTGGIGLIVGFCLLFLPLPFYAINGISLDGQVDLLSDLRGTGGALLALGTLITLGAFISELTRTSLITSILMYLSYGFGRLYAFIADGKPSGPVIFLMVAEIILGLLALYIYSQYQRNLSKV